MLASGSVRAAWTCAGRSSIHSNEAVYELAPVLGSSGESVGLGELVIGTVAFDKFADAVEASRSAPELENAPRV